MIYLNIYFEVKITSYVMIERKQHTLNIQPMKLELVQRFHITLKNLHANQSKNHQFHDKQPPVFDLLIIKS